MIIVFSGLDGAGKSTQIEILRKKLMHGGSSLKFYGQEGLHTML